MKNKTLYELFIGLLSLMAIIMIILDLMYRLPIIVVQSFYYINFIITIIFFIDYLIRLLISKGKLRFMFSNIIDCLSIFPILLIREIFLNLNLGRLIDIDTEIKIIKLIVLFILVIKFKNKIREAVKINKFLSKLLTICNNMFIINLT